MRKVYIIGCIIVLLLSIYLVKRNVICYIGYTTDLKDSTLLDVKIDMDGQSVYVDTIPSTFMHDIQRKVNLELNLGFHSITIFIANEQKEQTITFFYFFQKYLIIDFNSQIQRETGTDVFWIDLCNKYPFM